MDKLYSMSFESDIRVIKEVVSSALDFLKRALPLFSDDLASDIRLILSEALINAVTHGNKCDITKKVSLQIKTPGASVIEIYIDDEGKGFDYHSILQKGLGTESVTRESGRGVMLLKLLSDELCYNEKGNKVKICMKVDSDEQNSRYK